MRARKLTYAQLLCTTLALATIPAGAVAMSAPGHPMRAPAAANPAATKSTYTVGNVVYRSKSTFVDSGDVGGAAIKCGPNERLISPGVMLAALDDDAGFTGGVSSLAYNDTDQDGAPDDQAVVNVWNREPRTNELTGWAVCLKGPDRNDISYKSTLGHIDGEVFSITVANICAAGRVAGLGGSIDGSPTDSSMTSLGFGLHGRKPNPASGSITWVADATNVDYRFDLACLPTTTVVQKVAVVGLLPYEARTFIVPCPANTSAIGGGVLGRASPLLGSAPWDSKDGDNAPDDGWSVRVETGNYAGFAIEAICRKN